MANVRQLSRRQRFRQALLFVSSPIVILCLALAVILGGERVATPSVGWLRIWSLGEGSGTSAGGQLCA